MATFSISGQTALVTGGGGFIGSHLCRALVEIGCDVHAISRRMGPREIGNVRWWRGDLTDAATVRETLAAVQPDLIFHLASYVAGSRDLACVLPTFHNNLVSTVNLLTAAAEIRCRRVMLAGSLEEANPDGSSAVPCSPYAASKWAASAYGRMFYTLYGVPVVTSRLFMVYGPGQMDHQKLVPYVILSLLKKEAPRLSSGLRLVDWVYVGDVVEGLLAAAQAPGIEGKTIDVGSGKLVPIREIVNQLTELIEPGTQPSFGALADRTLERVCAANTEETKVLTGWTVRTSLAEGLQQTINWYRQQVRSGCLVL